MMTQAAKSKIKRAFKGAILDEKGGKFKVFNGAWALL